MNKFVKYTLWGVGGIVGVGVAGAAYLIATFDPNDYKEQIIQLVKENKQRDLHLDGEIKLSFYPNIGADLGKVSLSEHNNSEVFASIESARVSLALMPLFSKQVVVNEVFVDGVSAKLIKHKDGTTNIDDLLSKEESEPSSPIKLDIASVAVERTNLSYLDMSTGAEYQLQDLSLHTGRIAENEPTKINLATRLQAREPKVDVATKLATTLTFNLEQQQFKFGNLDATINGHVLDISDLNVSLAGQAEVNLLSKTFDLASLMLSATGQKGPDKFDVKLDAPKLALTEQAFTGEKLKLDANLTGAIGQLAAVLSLPEVSGSPEAVKSDSFKLDVDLKQAQQAFKASITSPLLINIPKQQVNLNNIVLALNATGDQFPNKSVSSEMKGKVHIDALKQLVEANLAGGLLQSQVKAQIGVRNFAQPNIQFDIDVDQFDADLYMPKGEAKQEVSKAEPEKPIDLSALRNLNLDGRLRVGAIKAANIKAKNLSVELKAHKGVLNLSPMSANLYDGRLNGSVSVNAVSTPVISINQSLTGINVAPLTKDVADFDTLEGHGNIALNVTTHGQLVSEFKRALNGTASLNLADGAIKGINVAKQIRDAKAIFGKGSQTTDADKTAKTDFSELKVSFNIANGVAHSNDLSMKSPLLRMGGEGDIYIAEDKIDYVAKATLVKTLEGQGGKDDLAGITVPVRIHGPFTDLKYTLDFKSMLKDAAEQKVKAQIEEKKQEVTEKVQDKIKDVFKGFFN